MQTKHIERQATLYVASIGEQSTIQWIERIEQSIHL